MAIVKGEIESLKRLKSTLKEKGIDRFNSIASINEFVKNFENEKAHYVNSLQEELENEIANMGNELPILEAYNNKNNQIEKIRKQEKVDFFFNKYAKHKISKPDDWLDKADRILYMIFFKVMTVFVKIEVSLSSDPIDDASKRKQDVLRSKFDYLSNNKEQVLIERSVEHLNKLNDTKEVVDELYPLIAGAVGERLVEKEVSKLSDNFVLFNDFSLKFEKPIYYKAENKRIFSVQIDHLLVTNAGVFILETKNWSKKSIQSYNLRSPIAQIQRARYALYIHLHNSMNSFSFGLKKHAWGKKEIPIRNVIVMIHSKPQERFQYVQIKTVHNVNKYINFFDPIFTDDEVVRISKHLDRIREV